MNDKMTGKGLIRYTLISLLLGVAPIIIVFSIYFMNKDSNITSYLFEITNGYNRDFSEQHLKVSTIASTYTKTAPTFAILMYALCWNKLDLKVNDFGLKNGLSSFQVYLFYSQAHII